MRILLDECCRGLVGALRRDGHDVLAAAESLARRPDPDLAVIAGDLNRMVVTRDYDFGLISRGLGEASPCVILLSSSLEPQAEWIRLREVIALYGEALMQCFTVVDPHRERVRPLPRA